MAKPRCPEYGRIFTDCEDKAKEAKSVWRQVIDELEAKGAVTSLRVKIADRYARACAEYAALYPITAKEGPVKRGPNGGDVFNFRWSAVEKLNDRLAKFEDQLRLDLRNSDIGDKAPAAKPTKADDYLD